MSLSFAEKASRKLTRKHLPKTAKRLGVSVEKLKTLPSWVWKGEGCTKEEYVIFVKEQRVLETQARIIVRKNAKKMGVSLEYLKAQPLWVRENRVATVEEFTEWAHNQHPRACKEYRAAYPLSYYKGKCSYCVFWKKPCISFFSQTGICETGIFEPDRISITTWNDFQKMFRKAQRKVGKIVNQK